MRPNRRIDRRPRVAVIVAAAMAGAVALAGGSALARTQTPTNTGTPAILGSALQGQTLTGQNGAWSGTGTITFAYEWLRCDASGAISTCTPIPGATGISHVLGTDDVGRRLRFEVEASDNSGTTIEVSAPTATVAADGAGVPVLQQQPTISGTAAQGQTLTAAPGTWSGTAPITYAYQWLRCNSAGQNCVPIGGATTTAYSAGSADGGSRLRVRVIATNAAGAGAAESSATSVVGGGSATGSGPPANATAPSISGTPDSGSTLRASPGTWTGAPTITYSYQWSRCTTTSLSSCFDIFGETSSMLALGQDDVDYRIRVEVTARNSSGSESEFSAPTALVTAGAGGGGGGSGGGGDSGDEATSCNTSINGAIELIGGRVSIPSTSVSLPEQLFVDRVVFTPNPVRTRGRSIRVQIQIVDTRGCLVRDALVFVRSVPAVTSSVQDRPTRRDGTLTANLAIRRSFPLRDGRSVQFFIRVRKPGDPLLTGVGTRRLVQVRTEAP